MSAPLQRLGLATSITITIAALGAGACSHGGQAAPDGSTPVAAVTEPTDAELLPLDASVEAIADAAREAATAREAWLDGRLLRATTERVHSDSSGGTYDSELLQYRGQRLLRAWSTRTTEGRAVVWEFAELFTGSDVRRWFLVGHNLQIAAHKGTPQHVRFDRWFDHGAVALDGIRQEPMAEVDGRSCFVFAFDVKDSPEGPVYLFEGPLERGHIVEWLPRSGLRIAGARVDDGEQQALTALKANRWLEGADPTALAWRVKATPFRPRLRPVTDHAPVVPGLPDRNTRTFQSTDAFDLCQRLWLDRATLLPARIDGIGITEDGTREVSLRWSDWREIGDSPTMASRLETWIDDVHYATTEVRSYEPIEIGAALFDPRALQVDMEQHAQANNRAEYEVLIARTDVKQAEPDPARDEVFHPDRVVAELGLDGDMVVADVGAGTGYFTPHLARAVGPTGRVIATEINPALVAYLEERMSDPRHDPHGVVQGHLNTFEDLGLPAQSLDVAFLAGVGLGRFVNLAEDNRRMLTSVYEAVRPGGRLAVIENRSQGSRLPLLSLPWVLLDDDLVLDCTDLGCKDIPAMFGPMDAVLITSWESVGFEFERSIDLIEGQAFLIFRRPAP